MKSFARICKDIKEVKIQGAENIAVAGVKAMKLKGASVKKLLSLRLTEPLLRNSLRAYGLFGEKFVLDHIESSRNEFISHGKKIINSSQIIFTHCHSSSVIRILKEAKKQGKKFDVINTETRPLYQGRKTAEELSNVGIKVTNIVDSAAGDALTKGGKIKKADLMIIGCDAILSDGSIINKIGSGMFAELAYMHKIPVYAVGNSWKFSSGNVKIEERNFKEIWKNASKRIKIKNPAFEKIDKRHITGIISELGILTPDEFVRAVKKKYPWIK